jgi:opacity protein-like surface antigen
MKSLKPGLLISTSLLALMAINGAAGAADLPAKKPSAPPPPAFTWEGVYVGVHAGYGFNNISEQATDYVPGYSGFANPVGVYDQNSYSSRGPLTGFQFGYNKQYGHFVLGGEWDLDYVGQNTNKTVFGGLGLATGGPIQTNIQDSFRWSARARAGYADDRSLYYVTGGLVSGGASIRHNYWNVPGTTPYTSGTDLNNTPINPFTTSNFGGSGQYNVERFGWSVGAGIEYAFTNQWSANVEYRHNDFGTATVSSNLFPGLSFHERAYEDTVRLGLNYHTGLPFFVTTLPEQTPAEPPKQATAAAPAAPPPPPDPSFIGRLYHAYADEWGLDAPISDPNAPPSRRAYFPPAPTSQPPYPFTEWSFGGSQAIGATTPNSVDAPLMKALSPTPAGKWLEDNHIQIYGWINPGFNISSARSLPGTLVGGNAPAAYAYQPNVLQLDQAVVIIERLPDEVQKDHWDWGFRLSPLYGETYRYTTAGGLWSHQLQKWNQFAGYDIPMMYGELYIPNIFEGVNIRFGRYISLPDIEAQLAPNNYMYSHSMTYGFDNYTNTGAVATVQVTKNFMLQGGLSIGTEAMPWQGRHTFLPPVQGGTLYQPVPGVFAMTGTQSYYSGQVDPGLKPTFTACARYQTDTAYDNIYLCMNGINTGTFGYNNLQWYGGTYYHKFNDDWHISIEAWHMQENNVPNVNSIVNSTIGLTVPNPFYYMVNGPYLAQCPKNPNPTCTAQEWSTLAYLNYKFSPRDNLSWRAEYFNDINGQRSGTKTAYFNYGMGWQHWFSPTIEVRPEVAFYHSLQAPAFQTAAPLLGGIGTKSNVTVFSADLLWHF